MPTRADAGRLLRVFTEDVGVPNYILVDGAKEQTGTNSAFMQTVRQLKMKTRHTEPYSPWQNCCGTTIGLLKKIWQQTIAHNNVHRQIWDYALVYDAEILSQTTRKEGDRSGYEKVTGDTPDISKWFDFSFYDHVWYWDTPSDNTSDVKIVRWLGVSHRIGSRLCYWIIRENVHVLSRTTVQHMTLLDMSVAYIQAKVMLYDTTLYERLNDDNFLLNPNNNNAFLLDLDDLDDETVIPRNGDEHAIDVDDVIPQDDPTEEAFDTLLNAELSINVGDKHTLVTLTKRARGADGRPIGQRDDNPFLDTCVYEVRMPDGSSCELTYNVIAENLFSPCDSEGRLYQLPRSSWTADRKSVV